MAVEDKNGLTFKLRRLMCSSALTFKVDDDKKGKRFFERR